MAFITTERLEIEPAEPDDAEDIAEINHSDGMRTYGGLKRPSQVQDIKDWITDGDDIVLGIWYDDTFIGYIGIHQDNEISRTEELYIYLRDEKQGKGFGPEALHATIQYCFDELNMHKIAGRVFEHNEPSQTMLERLGFTKEGEHRDELYKQGAYRDIYRYGLLKGELEAPE